jgi:Raf kinase inhibitor-like YbhB/YbcL family protein
MIKRAVLLLATALAVGPYCLAETDKAEVHKMETHKIVGISVTSTAFGAGAPVPKQYTGDGQDMSPALAWSKAPTGTQSLALLCEDPDAPRGTWYHWIMFNMPATLNGLGENVPKNETFKDGSTQGTNDFGKIGYNGPKPPPGSIHHYHFKIMALDTKLNLKPSARKDEILAAVKGHILGEGELIGTYQR